jgi:hypothetical protein
MRRSASPAVQPKKNAVALLVTGSIRWLGGCLSKCVSSRINSPCRRPNQNWRNTGEYTARNEINEDKSMNCEADSPKSASPHSVSHDDIINAKDTAQGNANQICEPGR